MKKQLFIIMLSLVGMSSIQQLDAMQGNDSTLACKKLGTGPFPTQEEINNAFKKKHMNSDSQEDVKLRRAKSVLYSNFISRKIALQNKTYQVAIGKRIRTGLFTQQVLYLERNTDINSSWKNEVWVNVYDYKRIFGALGLFGSAAVGLTYWYRNELGLLIKPS